MSRALGLVAAVLVLGGATGVAGAALAAGPDQARVVVEPSSADVVLGESLDLTVTVTNPGPDATRPMVVHLDVTDPEQATSVDPEDWTSTLSKPVAALEPGATTTVDWTLQPISGGTFSVYAVVLAPGSGSLGASGVTTVVVADQRSLNPDGVLPVALGVPAVVGALWLANLRRSRRT